MLDDVMSNDLHMGSRMLSSRSRGQRLQVGLGFTGGYEEEGEREKGCQ